MIKHSTENRRLLGRALSDCASDPTGISGFEPQPETKHRIGITGAPGAGKSSLISQLARMRSSPSNSMAILAIDPTSPLSSGSILGDRIRMDYAATLDDVFIRSIPSRGSFDGLCDNVETMLRTLERNDFDEIILETVGVGQAQYAIRKVTDTVVIVFSPNAGDSIQAMKAGLMELGDIYVVNKSDLREASRCSAEIKTALGRQLRTNDWRPPVLLTSCVSGTGFETLSEAIDEHKAWQQQNRDVQSTIRERTRRHVAEILSRQLASAVDMAARRDLENIGSAAEAIRARFCGESKP